MILIGLSWLIYWVLVDLLNVDAITSLLVVGILFIGFGLVMGERPLKR